MGQAVTALIRPLAWEPPVGVALKRPKKKKKRRRRRCGTYITKEYYSAIKNNEIMPFAAIWMDLEIIMVSEVSQRKTNIA